MCREVTCETVNLVTSLPKNSDCNSKQLRELARTKGRSRLIQFSYQRPNGRSFLNLRFQRLIGISRKRGRTISYRLTGRIFFLSLINIPFLQTSPTPKEKNKRGTNITQQKGWQMLRHTPPRPDPVILLQSNFN